MHKGWGGSTLPQAGGKMYRVGGEKIEKRKKRGKIRQIIGNIRLKIGKRGGKSRKIIKFG